LSQINGKYRKTAVAILIAATGLLASCGFHPLYGGGESSGTVFAAEHQVAIATMPDRSGQYLRNQLIDRLNPNGQPEKAVYSLSAKINESIDKLNIARDSSVTRGQIVLKVEFKLTRMADRKVVYSGASHALNAYTVTAEQYAALINEQDARERSLEEIADDIALRVGLFLEHQDDAGTAGG
jgi:LPS-assembly lipoprotein